ncbi:MAG: Hydrophobe/amphiphile efflux, partial [Burkholderiaceae bacterium]|nr:Hydrophobe/amphiphile efflux [Burkholderiaceae bacterium]
PMAFFGGSTGVIYRQFSITIVSAMALSVLVAIIFTPALCATMLKPVEKGHGHGEGGRLSGFFGWFNRMFARNAQRYESAVGKILGRSVRFLAIYVAIIGVLALLFLRLPTSFLPEEDQGVMFTQIILPAGATQERTVEVLKKVEHQFLVNEKDSVRSIFAAAGFSFAGQGQNMGLGFVGMKDWDDRPEPGQDVKSVAGRAMGAFAQIKEAMVFAFVPPASATTH